jgi:hypothetical protein
MVVGSRRLEGDERPILGMLLDRAPRADIAAVLRLTEHGFDRRLHGMLARLAAPSHHPPGCSF